MSDQSGTDRSAVQTETSAATAPSRRSDLGDARPDVLYSDQALVAGQWQAVQRARIRRRVVTEIETIEVEVRREELVVEFDDLVHDQRPLPLGQAPVVPEPVVTVLRREVPYIRLVVEPYERVTARVVAVETQAPVSVELTAEHSSVDIIR